MGERCTQLSVEERRKIERWRAAKISPEEIARVLGRHRSTIFRELRRNHFQDRDFPKVVGYVARAAQLQTADRRAAQKAGSARGAENHRERATEGGLDARADRGPNEA